MPAGDESLCRLQGARDDFGVDAACCESEVIAMNPRLYFCARYSNSNSPAQTFVRDQEPDYVSLVVLAFDYGGTVIQPSDPCTEFQDSTGRVVKRDVQQETFYVSRLYKAGHFYRGVHTCCSECGGICCCLIGWTRSRHEVPRRS